MKRRALHRQIFVQVLAAILAGMLLGHFHPELGAAMKPLGDGFIKLIKMLIAPIIFCTVVAGLAGMDSLKKVGRTGGLALLYFEIVTTLALVLGLLAANVFLPGAGMNVDPARLDADAVGAYAKAASTRMRSVADYLMSVIPASPVEAFAEGNILQVLFFALLFGVALNRSGGRGTLVYEFIEKTERVLFVIMGMIVKLAPVGAFGAIAFTVGVYGLESMLPLGKLIAVFWATCLIFVLLVLGAVAGLHGFSIWKFLAYIKDELLIVLGTSSSESVLPRMLDKLERLGAGKSVVGLVLPAGYSFNLAGTCIYLTLAAVFIAQATNLPFSAWEQLALLAVLMLTSKGATGVAGSGFIVLAATLSAMEGIPVAGMALLIGIDRIMSDGRALANLVGNGVATLVVAKWSGELDMARLKHELNSPHNSSG